MENGRTTMEKGGSLLTSLPPNYVTLASLKKRREEEERLKQEEEQRKREKEEEEEKARILKEEQEQEEERARKEDEEVKRFKKGFGRGRKPNLESATEEGSEISIKKTDDWREKRNERRKKWKQKKAERKAKSQLQKDASSGGSTAEVEKQSQSSPNPTVRVVVVVDESKETKPQGSDREVQVVDEGRRRRWRGGRKEWRKKEESLTNSVAEIAPSVGGISVVSESNIEKKSSGSPPPPRNWGFRSNNRRRGRERRFENRVRENGNLMWVKKQQVTAESTVADSSIATPLPCSSIKFDVEEFVTPESFNAEVIVPSESMLPTAQRQDDEVLFPEIMYPSTSTAGPQTTLRRSSRFRMN